MSTTYIIGHEKPDTDAVVASMALEYLYRQHPDFGHVNPVAAVTGNLNPETNFLFLKFDVTAPPKISAQDIGADDTVVLVDHNEASQRLEGLDEEKIVEIVDHHKINLNLNKPIFTTFKPWGSSSTIAYYLMKKYDIKPDKKLASLMLASILSDTVGFKSATTTAKDEKFGKELADIAGIEDLDGFTLEIFKAKSNISDLTDQQIVKNDYKVFDFGKKTFIGQLETVEQDEIVTNKLEGLLSAMADVKTEEGVDLIFLAITDVLKVNTKLLILGDDEQVAAEKAFEGKVADHILDIGPKMSRKKEIAPPIERALS